MSRYAPVVPHETVRVNESRKMIAADGTRLSPIVIAESHS